MVVVNWSLYKMMVLEILDNTNTYRRLPKDPTMVFSEKLQLLLLDGSALGAVSERRIVSSCGSQASSFLFHGLPKTLQPIISGIGFFGGSVCRLGWTVTSRPLSNGLQVT